MKSVLLGGAAALASMAYVAISPASALPGAGPASVTRSDSGLQEVRARRRHRVIRRHTRAQVWHEPTAPGVRPGAVSNGPYWSSPYECFTDEGQGRFSPCDRGRP